MYPLTTSRESQDIGGFFERPLSDIVIIIILIYLVTAIWIPTEKLEKVKYIIIEYGYLCTYEYLYYIIPNKVGSNKTGLLLWQ